MRILLDTHLLFWALDAPDKLPKKVKPLLEDPYQKILFSAASIWEIAIKCQIGREDFQFKSTEIVAAALNTGFIELPVYSSATSLVSTLPIFHKDPFPLIDYWSRKLSPNRSGCSRWIHNLANIPNLCRFFNRRAD